MHNMFYNIQKITYLGLETKKALIYFQDQGFFVKVYRGF